MLLVTYRPGYRHNWGEKSYYSQITLHPLGEAESGALIASVLGVADIPRDLDELISRKGRGQSLLSGRDHQLVPGTRDYPA